MENSYRTSNSGLYTPVDNGFDLGSLLDTKGSGFLDSKSYDGKGGYTSQQGWGSALGGLMSAYSGYQANQLGKDQLEELKKQNLFEQEGSLAQMQSDREILYRQLNKNSAFRQFFNNANAGRALNREGIANLYQGDNAGSSVIQDDGSMKNPVVLPTIPGREPATNASMPGTPTGGPTNATASAFAGLPGATPPVGTAKSTMATTQPSVAQPTQMKANPNKKIQ